ncbi:MAG: glycosyltransferase, partial [Chloroflexota bacterium]|nr:glycosyltransferase [Chloroflexota bacterium]
VTEGSAQHQEPFLLRAAAQALANEPVEALLATGLNRDPARLDIGPRAQNIRVAAWLSYRQLLPRCSAVVTNGGSGTVMAALQSGVPLVVVPTHWDRPSNARRVVEAGVGVQLAPAECTPERLRAAVREVLNVPSYRANAQRASELLAQAPGPDGAAELLVQLAGSEDIRAPQEEAALQGGWQ